MLLRISFLACLLAGCAAIGDEPYPSTHGVPAELEVGATLYFDHCRTCHGEGATGTWRHWESIVGSTEILDQVREGGGGMDPFPATVLSDEDVAEIERYLVWLGETTEGG